MLDSLPKGSERPLKVVIDAQLTPKSHGGSALALLALIRALGRLGDDSRYLLAVANEEQEAFWRPVLGPNQSIVATFRSSVAAPSAKRRAAKLLLKPVLPAARWLARSLVEMAVGTRSWPDVPISDGFYESLGCDVVHFSWQQYMLCALPSVYNPHDLQHLHYPQFFTPKVIAWRETMYPAGCKFAQTVIVGSQWAKSDVVRQYHTDPSKVQIIPEGAVNQFDTHIQPSRDVRERYRLPRAFVLYPGITWEHKNHIRLLEALAYLRDARGIEVALVCTGRLHEPHWSRVQRRIEELQLQSQAMFLGYVSENDLQGILELATSVVVPSLFESSSLPVFEAWKAGIPVACADNTALPEQLSDAGLLFDPYDVGAIAQAVEALATNEALRADLKERGTRRLRDFNWEVTAKAYRAVYRKAARRQLSDEDRELLGTNWMLEPGGVARSATAGLEEPR